MYDFFLLCEKVISRKKFQGMVITFLKGLRAARLSCTTGNRLRNFFVFAVAL